MKKYIIGLFSAICLMGAGCTEFEDYAPVNMGEGPAVTLSVEKTNVDAFNLTVTPAEGTVYYAYIVTNQAQTIDAETLLQAGYEGAELLKAAETPSLAKAYNNQKIGTTYYVYAVASDANGLCGAVASATVDLPDTEAPYLVSVPDGNLYTATNSGRSVTLTYNETVTRGEGAITYNVTKGDLTSYASGTIETVVINGESVTITLPESVAFDANEAKSYVFLDFAAGAFVDGAGNQSAALKGGVDQETQLVGAPYWEYVPGGGTTGDVTIEIDDTKGYGSYVFIYTSMIDNKTYGDPLQIYRGSDLSATADCDYGIVGFAAYAYDEGTDYGYIKANVADGALNLYHRYMVGYATVQGTQYAIAVFGVIYDTASGQVTGLYDSETVPFTPNAQEPRILGTDVVMAYGACDKTSGNVQGFLDIMTGCMLVPEALVPQSSVAQSFVPSLNKQMKANAVKKYLESAEFAVQAKKILKK